jgi:V8-like Glu-specific endopeptidase
MRARRRNGHHATGPDNGEQTPSDDSRPQERAQWFARPYARLAVVVVLTVGVVVTMTPANGAATDIASGFARAVQRLVAPSRNGQAFAGTPAVGALFTSDAGKLGHHFCTASVVNSPDGDLVLTAAHCVTGVQGTVTFVPGYNGGKAPFGVWLVNKVYADGAWNSTASPNDDVAFLRVSQPGSSVPIEDVTGAEQLGIGAPAREMVEVIGYPDSSDQAITCRNWTTEPMADQLEFDCGGFTGGTSGGPFLAGVDPSTGQGTVVGVIGGYEQGGFSPSISYSCEFGSNVAALYKAAVAGG